MVRGKFRSVLIVETGSLRGRVHDDVIMTDASLDTKRCRLETSEEADSFFQ